MLHHRSLPRSQEFPHADLHERLDDHEAAAAAYRRALAVAGTSAEREHIAARLARLEQEPGAR